MTHTHILEVVGTRIRFIIRNNSPVIDWADIMERMEA